MSVFVNSPQEALNKMGQSEEIDRPDSSERRGISQDKATENPVGAVIGITGTEITDHKQTEGLDQVLADLTQEISRRRKAEEQHSTSEQRYQTLYDNNPSMYFTLSQEGMVFSVNRFGADQLGYDADALIGHSILRVFRPEDHQTVLGQLIVCAANPAELFQWEIQKVRHDGSQIWVKERARAIHDQNGQLLILIVCEDITLHKQVASSLRESELAIRSLQAATSAPGLTFEQRMQTVLELGCRRFQLPIGMFSMLVDDHLEIHQVWPPTGSIAPGTRVPLCQTYCSAALQASGPLSFEHASASQWRHHPGYATVGFESYIGTKLSEQDNTYGTLCFMGHVPYPGTFSEADTDFLLLMARWVVSELQRQRTEQALLGSEGKFRTFVETTRDWVWEVDDRAVYTYASPRIHDILGYAPEEIIGKTPFDLMPPEEALRVAAIFGPIAETHQPFTLLENINRHKDGRLIVLETSGTPIFDGNGAFRGYHGIDRDITDRRKAQEALRNHEARWRQFVADAPVGLVIHDERHRLLSANKSFCALTGYREQDIIGKTYAVYTHPEDLADNLVLTNAFIQDTDSSHSYEQRYIRKTGEIMWVAATTTEVELPGQVGPLMLTVVEDISERKRITEERERISQDLHDGILQSLYAVGIGLEHIRHRINRVSPTNARRLDGSVDQLNTLIREVRSFIPRMQIPPIQQGTFDQALMAIVESLTVTGMHDIHVDIDKSATEGLARTQCGPVLSIAKEALSNSLRHAHAVHRTLTVRFYRGKIRLECSDDGKGFNPTTRKQAGMGLANMRARAKKLGARLTIRSRPGKGTHVVLDIPLPAPQSTV